MARQAVGWGSVLNCQSSLPSCRLPASAGMSDSSDSSPPASSSRTLQSGFSDRRLAMTAPADPPPTAKKKKKIGRERKLRSNAWEGSKRRKSKRFCAAKYVVAICDPFYCSMKNARAGESDGAWNGRGVCMRVANEMLVRYSTFCAGSKLSVHRGSPFGTRQTILVIYLSVHISSIRGQDE